MLCPPPQRTKWWERGSVCEARLRRKQNGGRKTESVKAVLTENLTVDRKLSRHYEKSLVYRVAMQSVTQLWGRVCVFPLAEVGNNTSTVIPASRKRQRKGNPLVSD
jgi:hypothetical protein